MDRNENNEMDFGQVRSLSRTDLALEVRESFPDDDVEIQGVVLKEDYNKRKNIKVTTVEIQDELGAKAMGKPIGTYITIEAPELDRSDEGIHKPVMEEIVKYIKMMVGDVLEKEVLIAGLGNREVTPDALGPWVVDNLFITRHLIRELGKEFKEQHKIGNVSAIAPGVMAQTGMETSEILLGIIEKTAPDLLIVIDALAARSTQRLNKTIQITDTGISPGSGVGNNRKALNKDTLGIDVIALGVPTVVDAATIVNDRLWEFMSKQDFSEQEIYGFINEVNEDAIENMFVTPKNIDESVKRMSFTISEAMNQCFH